jgi:hypothetical protein
MSELTPDQQVRTGFAGFIAGVICLLVFICGVVVLIGWLTHDGDETPETEVDQELHSATTPVEPAPAKKAWNEFNFRRTDDTLPRIIEVEVNPGQTRIIETSKRPFKLDTNGRCLIQARQGSFQRAFHDYKVKWTDYCSGMKVYYDYEEQIRTTHVAAYLPPEAKKPVTVFITFTDVN